MPNPEPDSTRPLAIPTPARDSDVDTALSLRLKHDALRRRRCFQCCGCATAVLLLLAVVLVVLVVTVFRVRDPTLTMDSVSIQRLNLDTSNLLSASAFNLSLAAAISVKNPNYASLKFTNTTTAISYSGTEVGEARTPPGNARARRTMRINVTVDVIPERIVTVRSLAGDVLSRRALTLNSVTQIEGRVKIIGIKKHVDVRMECEITVAIESSSISGMDCKRHVSL